MSETVATGVVRNGVVVPNIPLPEGAWVELHVRGVPPEIPGELRDELAAWDVASSQALELVERLAEQMEADEKK